MSKGLTPQEFVRQVYYCQERVLLDFYPYDDKFREVLYEANMAIEELQGYEDWTWLRKSKCYGLLDEVANGSDGIVQFELGEDVYKPSTLYGDGIRLYYHKPLPERVKPEDWDEEEQGEWVPEPYTVEEYEASIDYAHYLRIPYVSAGNSTWQDKHQRDIALRLDTEDYSLKAMIVGNTIRFNRPLTPAEKDKVIVIDVQKKLDLFHVCDDTCLGIEPTKTVDYPANPCAKEWEQETTPICTEVPDPMYLVVKVASRHADSSPSAGGRLATLQDWAQKLLSSMRQHNAVATLPDSIEYDGIDYVDVW